MENKHLRIIANPYLLKKHIDNDILKNMMIYYIVYLKDIMR